MITAPEILCCDLVYRLGWALLHSLWQIALLASVVAALLAALRRRSANLRYVIGCAGLAVISILPVVTYCVMPGPLRPESAAGAIPPDNPAAASIDHSPALSGPPQGTLASARPPDSGPSGANAERGSLPLSSRPSPEFTPAAEPATPLAERVSQALLPWIPWFVVVWVAGVFLLSLWHLGGWTAMQRLKRLATTPAGPDGARRLAELIERMRLSRPVRMLQSAMVDVPAVIGWLRPVLLVPAAMLGELSPQQIDAVLAHELAHVRRYDYLVNLWQTLIETLLFYHPAVWWLSRRIRIERENCCDDAAVALCGSRVDFAAALTALEQGRLAPRLAVAASGADRAGTALSRVRRVLGLPNRDLHDWRASLGGGFGALLLIGTLAGYVATGAAHDQGPGEKTALPLPATQTAASLLDAFRAAENSWTQAEVGKKLIVLGDKSIVPDMAKILKSEDRRERCNAAWVLAGLGDRRGLSALLAELKDTGQRPTKLIRSDGTPNVPGQIAQDRYYAVHVLGELGDQKAVPELIEVLKDESLNYKAAIVLGSLGDRRAIPALKEMLNTCRPDHRLWAGSGLGKLGDPLGVPTVAEFLKHPQWTQRRHAADALGEFQDKRALPALTDALKDKQAEVRVSAARALGRLADQAAIPALEALLDDHELTTSGPPTAVRDAAAEAIRQIRGAQAPPPAPQPAPPKLPVGKELLPPGNETPLKSALVGNVVLVAACEAVGEAKTYLGRSGVMQAQQDFRLVEVFYGDDPPNKTISLPYSYLAGGVGFATHGRAIRPGERVIWIAEDQFGERVSGRQALADTPENRQAIKELVLSIPSSVKANVAQLRAEARLRAELGKALPSGWYQPSYGTHKVAPLHWDEGPGQVNLFQRKDFKPDDAKRGRGGQIYLWIMGPGYTPKADKFAGQEPGPQEPPAREISLWRGRRVFVWGSAPDWPDWETQTRKALAATEGDRTAQTPADTAWGEAVEGVDCRLWTDLRVWEADQTPVLNAEVRNRGKLALKIVPDATLQELQFDGKWYTSPERFEEGAALLKQPSPFPPGKEYGNLPVRLLPDRWGWFGSPQPGPAVPKGPKPGKHSVRIAFTAQPADPAKGKPLRVVSNPVEIEIAAEKIQWGRNANGLQAGLAFDVQERPYHVGELVSFRIYVRNLSGKTVAVVDSGTTGWMPTVSDSAGKPVMVAGQFDGPVQRRRQILPDGQTLLVGTVALMLDQNPEARASQPFHAHLAPGTYRVSQKYRFADEPEATWSGELASGELELKVVPAATPAEGAGTDWGPAVEGVQCRLEADKPTWKAAEMPTLKAYVRHQAETTLFLSNHPMFGAQLEVDGHWHRWNAPVAWAGPSHSSSKFRTKDEQPLAITLDENWRRVDNKEPLRVDPGRHVIRFAWEGHPEKGPREGPDEQRSIVLVSNPLEITVPPERPQPKPSDLHADDRNAAAALQQLGAILAADDQGKIRTVRLSRTAATDRDLVHLAGLSGLKALYLDDTRISDAGLQHLAGLTGLETLSVNYTRISDAGLEHLKGLKGLRSLALLDTEVTAAALRELKKTRPELQTTVDPLKLSGLGDLRGWRNSAKLNDEYELVSVDLLDANISDAALARLKDRQSLQDVCLFKANITDAGLAELRKLTDLDTLYLSGTRITDAGLECLKDMKKLKTLFLADTQIGDGGLARLSGLTNLESLLIDGTQVTDAGMAHLRPFKKLTLLRLNNCQISGTGLSHLRDSTRLTALELRGTAVSDTGLVHLQPLVNLELLYLSHTSVTDAGLGYLTGLRKLRALEIQDTAITDDGIQRLKQALPNTSIHR